MEQGIVRHIIYCNFRLEILTVYFYALYYEILLGNLHLNVTTPRFNPDVLNMIEPFVYDWVARYRGSISAEHGLGFKKRNVIFYSKSKEAVSLMSSIKNIIDPNRILNPYKVFPDQQ